MTDQPALSPKFTAAMDMLERTGAQQIQIRYSDDEQPVVWFAVAVYTGNRWETAAGHNPEQAVLRLCEQLIDGGHCTHCKRGSGFDPDGGLLFASITAISPDGSRTDEVCWYGWHPATASFRRGCEQ